MPLRQAETYTQAELDGFKAAFARTQARMNRCLRVAQVGAIALAITMLVHLA